MTLTRHSFYAGATLLCLISLWHERTSVGPDIFREGHFSSGVREWEQQESPDMMNFHPTKVALPDYTQSFGALCGRDLMQSPRTQRGSPCLTLTPAVGSCCEENFNTDQSWKGAASHACRVSNVIEHQSRVREQRYRSSAVVSLSGFIRQEPLMY